MKYWFFLLFFPFFLNAEIAPQAQIELSNNKTELSPSVDSDLVPFAPLFNLEPKLPLYIDNQNQQMLLSPDRLLAEQKNNVQRIKDHTFPWLFLLIASALSIGTVIIAKLKPKFFATILPQKPTKSLQEQTQEKLEHLKKEGNASQNLRDLYLKAADLNMWYLSKRYNQKLSIADFTEIEPVLKSLNLNAPTEFKEQLDSYLKEIFHVKFANHSLSYRQYENALDITQKLIKIL